MKRQKRFLCVCLGGNVRSAALAFQLKQAGQDAIPASAFSNSPATLKMLLKWADHVVVLAEEVGPYLPKELLKSPKLCLVDVGEDRFGSPFHPELQGMLAPIVAAWQERNWNIHGA